MLAIRDRAPVLDMTAILREHCHSLEAQLDAKTSALAELEGKYRRDIKARDGALSTMKRMLGRRGLTPSGAGESSPQPPQPQPEERRGRLCIVLLGRYGDIINFLPVARWLYQTSGIKPFWAVSKPFADIFDGVSYVAPIVVDEDYARPMKVGDAMRAKGLIAIQPQPWGTDFSCDHHTAHFNLEQWRLAGHLEKWADNDMRPHFDRRDEGREFRCRKQHLDPARPLLLYNGHGISTPFADKEALLEALRGKYGATVQILDLATVRAERFYDLLGLYEKAVALVTVDTAHLHLAGDATVPVIAVMPDGWSAAAPKCNVVETLSQARWQEQMAPAFAAIDAALLKQRPPKIVHGYEWHGQTAPRIVRAVETWQCLRERHGWIDGRYSRYRRDARELGDKRDLPYLKDVLEFALHGAGTGPLSDEDIVVFTNDDTILHPETHQAVMTTLAVADAGCSSRIDIQRFAEAPLGAPPKDRHDLRYIGRDLFCFRARWLRKHWEELPDYLLGAAGWDIGLTAMIRASAGAPPRQEQDLEMVQSDCELPYGYVFHERHIPLWEDKQLMLQPSNYHNVVLLRQWAGLFAPNFRLPWF